MKSLLLLAIAAASAWSADIVLPSSPLARAVTVPVLVRPVDTPKFYAPYRRQIVAWRFGNLLAPEGRAERLIPIAVNDPPGCREARVRDLLSGQTRTAASEVS